MHTPSLSREKGTGHWLASLNSVQKLECPLVCAQTLCAEVKIHRQSDNMYIQDVLLVNADYDAKLPCH